MSHPRRADDLSQIYVHPIVTADQVTVVSLAVLQLDELSNEIKQCIVTNCNAKLM